MLIWPCAQSIRNGCALASRLSPAVEYRTCPIAALKRPASGGSSGIYLANLFEKLGIANDIKPKAKLKQGGYVADLIKSGEAELGIHQISEILPVKEVTLVGPLPDEIQNYTIYAAGIGAGARDNAAAKELIEVFSGPVAAAVLKEKGMDKPGS